MKAMVYKMNQLQETEARKTVTTMTMTKMTMMMIMTMMMKTMKTMTMMKMTATTKTTKTTTMMKGLHLWCLLTSIWQRQYVHTLTLSHSFSALIALMQIRECCLQTLQKTSKYQTLRFLFMHFFDFSMTYSQLNFWTSTPISVSTPPLQQSIMLRVISAMPTAWLGSAYT